MKELELVKEFHKKFNHPIEKTPIIPEIKRIILRNNLIREELEELEVASQEEDIVEVADALIDILYVTYGAICEYGLADKAKELFDEVHSSNMSKLENGFPVYDNQGKVMKGSNYYAPNIRGVLNL